MTTTAEAIAVVRKSFLESKPMLPHRIRAAIEQVLEAVEEAGDDGCILRRKDVQAIMAACSRRPHSQAPGAAMAAIDIIREIERTVGTARDRSRA